jgi:hypothetical protein
MKLTRAQRRPQLASLDFGTNNGILGILNLVLRVLQDILVPLFELFQDLFGSDGEGEA